MRTWLFALLTLSLSAGASEGEAEPASSAETTTAAARYRIVLTAGNGKSAIVKGPVQARPDSGGAAAIGKCSGDLYVGPLVEGDAMADLKEWLEARAAEETTLRARLIFKDSDGNRLSKTPVADCAPTLQLFDAFDFNVPATAAEYVLVAKKLETADK